MMQWDGERSYFMVQWGGSRAYVMMQPPPLSCGQMTDMTENDIFPQTANYVCGRKKYHDFKLLRWQYRKSEVQNIDIGWPSNSLYAGQHWGPKIKSWMEKLLNNLNLIGKLQYRVTSR